MATPDPTTTYQIKDFIDAAQLRKDLVYSPNNLTDAMMQQASLFAHYGVLASQASRQVDVVKMLLENAESAVYQKVHGEKAVAGEKVTVPMMEALVARHERVISMKRALNEAKRVESSAKIAVEAFRHRRDMLIQHGLISREEMKGELRIMEKTELNRVFENQKHEVMARLKKPVTSEE